MISHGIRAPAIVAAVALGGVTSACAGGASAGLGGQIDGVVLAGPTCPVEQAEQPCPPRPVAGDVRLLSNGGVVRHSSTDAAGRYALDAPAGHYMLVVDVGGYFPRCPATPVDVPVAATVTVNIDCDTGIR